MPDGVFVEECETEAPVFHPMPPPTDDEVEALLLDVAQRVHAIFAKRGFFDDDASAAEVPGALEMLQQKAAMGQRSLALAPMQERTSPRGRRSAFVEGFSLHADLHLHANDREALERLLLYGARGPLSENRLRLLPDGRISYRIV